MRALRRRSSKGGLAGRLLRLAVRVALAGLAIAVLLVAIFRFLNPPVTYLMVQEWWRLGAIERDWVRLDAMADFLPLSAVSAEDSKFCEHHGFDLASIRAVLAANDGQLRGGSSISQQVAKNVFLWPDRSWLRKGFEAGFTVLIELLWSKRRIMEAYLNVAELGEGVFGVEAAARHYWGLSASELGPQRSARLMAVLPDPRNRSPVSGSGFIVRRGAAIQRGAALIRADGRGACFL